MKLKEKISKAQLLEMYRQMVLIREFENECYRQYMQKNVKGFLHVYSGEEAIAVGVMSLLEPQDYIVTHYRDHGHAIARGLDTKALMAELFGKATGVSKGKGGSMHLFDVKKRFMGGYAIVGGQLPIAVGLAMASKEKGENGLTICFFGDGAMQEGEFHESLNLASIWKLPVIFYCENNLYGMGASVSETYAGHDQIYKAGEPYKIPGVRVDGMNLFEVRRTTAEAVKHVRGGEGPMLIEAQTYRYRGHSISDPAGYRPKDEVEFWMTRDPIILLKKQLLSEGTATEEELKSIVKAAEEEIVAAVKFATESPFPEPAALHQEVYSH